MWPIRPALKHWKVPKLFEQCTSNNYILFQFLFINLSATAGTMSLGHKEFFQDFLKKLTVYPKKAKGGQFDSS